MKARCARTDGRVDHQLVARDGVMRARAAFVVEMIEH
jgi:hypothetical protein